MQAFNNNRDRSVAPGRSLLTSGDGARVYLVKRPCGEVRILLRDCSPSSLSMRGSRAGGVRPFIYSCGFQDSLIDFCQGPSGFGRLASDTEFTKLAKSRVIDGCAVSSLEPGYKSVFATGTLPGSTQEAMRGIACMSAQIVEWMTEYIRNICHDVRYVYVWEWQKRGALHIHVAITSRNIMGLRKIEKGWKRKWIMWLLKAQKQRGYSLFEPGIGMKGPSSFKDVRANCRPAIKDLGRYMSKYLSKQHGEESGGHFYCPSRWWGMSKNVRSDINKFRLCVGTPVLQPVDALQLVESLTANFAKFGANTFPFVNPFARFDRATVVFLKNEMRDEAWLSAVSQLGQYCVIDEPETAEDLKPKGREWW